MSNVTLPASGSVIATDTVSAAEHQLVKLEYGAAGSATQVSTTNPLPVTASSAAPVTIQGVQDTATSGAITTATSVVGPLSVTQRNVVTITANGTYAGVSIIMEASDDGGTTWYPLQCIDNSTGQAASSWTLTANASQSWDSAIGGYTHLRVRATAWTSGTCNVRMTAQSFAYDPVVAALAQSMDVDVTLTSVSAVNGVLLFQDVRGFKAVSVQLTGTWAGTVTFQASNDGTNFVACAGNAVNGTAIQSTTTANGIFLLPVSARYVRVICTTYTSGTISGVARLSSVPPFPTAAQIAGTVTANIGTGSLAAGTNAVGDVGVQYRANATGAASFVSVLSPATPAAATIKATAGRLIGWQLQNSASALRSVKVFNVAAPTLGTTAASFEIDIPAGGYAFFEVAGGIGFSTAMTYSVTSAKGLTDNTATGLAANDVSGSFFFA